MSKHSSFSRIRFAGWALVVGVGFAMGPLAAEEQKGLPVAKLERDTPVSFQKEILPIFRKSCLACHNQSDAEADVILETGKSIRESGFSDSIIEDGKPAEETLLFQVAAHLEDPIMPPEDNDVDAPALSPDQLALLKLWINQGAKDDSSQLAQDIQWYPLPPGLNPVYSTAVSPDGRFAAGSRANQVFLYDLPTGREISRLTDPAFLEDGLYDRPGIAHLDQIQSMAFAPSGDVLATSGYRCVKLWKQEPIGADVLTEAEGARVATVSGDNTVAIGLTSGDIQLHKNGKTTTLSTGSGAVRSLSFSSDSQLLLTANEKTLTLWHVESGEKALTVESSIAVNEATLVGGTQFVAAAGSDNKVHVWKLSQTDDAWSADAHKQLEGHGAAVTSVDAAPPAEGKPVQLVSGSADGTVRQWQLPEGNQVREMKHGSPVARVRVRADGDRFASCGQDAMLKLWNGADGAEVTAHQGDSQLEHRLNMAKQRAQLATTLLDAGKKQVETTDKNVATETENLKKAGEEITKAEGSLKEKEAEAAKETEDKKKAEEAKKAVDAAKKAVTDAKKKKEDTELNLKRAKRLAEEAKVKLAKAEEGDKAAKANLEVATEAAKPSYQPLISLAFSADGDTLAVGTKSGSVHVYGGDQARSIASLSGQEGDALAVGFVEGQVLSIGADGQALVRNTLSPWKLAKTIGAVNDPTVFVDRVTALRYSRDGKYLAAGGGEPSRSGHLKLFNVDSGELAWTSENAHSDTIVDISFSYDGQFIATGGTDKFVRIFNTGDGKLVRSLEGHTAHVLGVSWRADGLSIASAGADNVIKIWNVETGEQRRTIGGFAKQVTDVEFLGISQNIVSASGDNTVRQHNADDGKQAQNLSGAAFMHCVATTADGQFFTAGNHDGSLRAWVAADGKELHVLEAPKPEEPKAD